MLIDLLDYKFPPANGPLVQVRAATADSQYPALQALSNIGRVAAPQLQAAIVDSARTEAVRVNGIVALRLIYQYRAARPNDFVVRVQQYTDRAKQVPGVRASLLADLQALDEEYVRSARVSGRGDIDEFHGDLKFGDIAPPRSASPR